MTSSDWLSSFALAVRNRDYASACGLFDFRVVSFGTYAVRTNGLQQLEEAQWQKVWPHTEGFYFSRWDIIPGKDIVIVVAQWTSFTAAVKLRRTGRATLVLEDRSALDKLLCVHSHFSIDPVPEFVSVESRFGDLNPAEKRARSFAALNAVKFDF